MGSHGCHPRHPHPLPRIDLTMSRDLSASWPKGTGYDMRVKCPLLAQQYVALRGQGAVRDHLVEPHVIRYLIPLQPLHGIHLLHDQYSQGSGAI